MRESHGERTGELELVIRAVLWAVVLAFAVVWGVSAARAADNGVFLTGLSVVGPDTVPESGSARFKAVAVFSDGTRKRVTGRAAWSENSSFAVISAGVLETRPVGVEKQLTITAKYSSGGIIKTAKKKVTIVNSVVAKATLIDVRVSGAASVNEGTASSYTATASFSDGTHRDVTGEASWDEGSASARFGSPGVLTALEVGGNEKVTLTATYSSGGITRSGALVVTIVDLDSPPPLTGSHADKFAVFEGTKTCLQCHRDRAVEVYQSEHYQWKGKLGAINDFCIYPDPNHIGRLTNTYGVEVDAGCGKCHVGMGAKPVAAASPTDVQLENVDCLICHAPQYKRTVDPVTKARFIPDEEKMGMTILEAAVDIRKTSRDTCLNCHTKSGGGDNFKRGDLEEHHRSPGTRSFDVHMSPASLGGGDLHCTRCHRVSNHKIAGKGADLRVQEGTRPDCTTCHTATPPHSDSKINAYHLQRVHCTTCHIPSFAKVAPTDVFRDWGAPGELNLATGLYDPARTMEANVTPQYRFWDGQTSTFYDFGTAADAQPNGNVLMAGPVGSVSAPGSKIHPFKVHTALQPMDLETRYLLPLKIGFFYMEGDLMNAVPQGQDAVGWPRNPYDFRQTERWMGLFHEVSPKENALGYGGACTTCHGTSTPRMPLSSMGYEAVKPVADLCKTCHESKKYSFGSVHPRHSQKGYDCSECHSFSKAR